MAFVPKNERSKPASKTARVSSVHAKPFVYVEMRGRLHAQQLHACAGANFNQNNLGSCSRSFELMRDGQPLDFDAKAASQYLKETTAVHGTVQIDVTVGRGAFSGQAWGCDLSYDYVKINAEYTT